MGIVDVPEDKLRYLVCPAEPPFLLAFQPEQLGEIEPGLLQARGDLSRLSQLHAQAGEVNNAVVRLYGCPGCSQHVLAVGPKMQPASVMVSVSPEQAGEARKLLL